MFEPGEFERGDLVVLCGRPYLDDNFTLPIPGHKKWVLCRKGDIALIVDRILNGNIYKILVGETVVVADYQYLCALPKSSIKSTT